MGAGVRLIAGSKSPNPPALPRSRQELHHQAPPQSPELAAGQEL